MKKVFLGLVFAGISSVVYAQCTTHTYNVNGKFVTCTTCCYGGNCNTTCF